MYFNNLNTGTTHNNENKTHANYNLQEILLISDHIQMQILILVLYHQLLLQKFQ